MQLSREEFSEERGDRESKSIIRENKLYPRKSANSTTRDVMKLEILNLLKQKQIDMSQQNKHK